MASLPSFLQSLLSNGRITEAEYYTAASLVAQLKTKRSGAITINRDALPRNQLAAVRAVLNTVELAEQIFSYLSTADLVKGVSLTCHSFRNIVTTSPALQKTLFLQADEEDRVLRIPPARDVHYNIVQGYLEILIQDAGETLSSSPALRAMLLVQPPVKSARVFYDCACRVRGAGIISNSTGLTFGHASEAVDQHFKLKESQDVHRPCRCDTYVEIRLVIKLDVP